MSETPSSTRSELDPVTRGINRVTKALGGLGLVGLAATYALGTAEVHSDGVGIKKSMEITAGFDCGLGGGFRLPSSDVNFRCAERRSGTIAFVNVKGLDAPGGTHLSDDEVSKAAHNITGMLSTMTDGAVNLQPQVLSAPQSVTEDVKENMEHEKDGNCVNVAGEHTPSKAAVRHMPALRNARYVVGLGGTSCGINYYERGVKVKGRAGGIAHADGAARLIDIFTADSSQDPNREEVVEQLTNTGLHEQLHQEGLSHTNQVDCGEHDPEPAPNKPVNLDQLIATTLNDRAHCKFDEYGGLDNIMGANSGLNRHWRDSRFARERVSTAQSDFISGREPSGAHSRTALIDKPGVTTLLSRPSAKHGEPNGAIMSLPQPIEYVTDDGDMRQTFTHLVLDYKTPRAGKDFLRVYLTNSTEGHSFRMMQIGAIFIPGTGRTISFGNKTLAVNQLQSSDVQGLRIAVNSAHQS